MDAKLKEKIKSDVLVAGVGACTIIAFYFLTTLAKPGLVSWIATMPALLVIFLTAVSRINDITSTQKRYQLRRIGLTMSAVGAAGIAIAPLFGSDMPSWRGVMMTWGWALTWLTTPNMPPWWKYISGEYKLKKGQQA